MMHKTCTVFAFLLHYDLLIYFLQLFHLITSVNITFGHEHITWRINTALIKYLNTIFVLRIFITAIPFLFSELY